MYESLLKLYYKRFSNYEEIYQSRFNSEASIHLNISIHDNPAFIFICPEITDLLIEIYKINMEIQLRQMYLPKVLIQLYLVNALKDEILLTNEIEGIKSTKKEIEEAIVAQKTNKYVRFKGLVEKYFALIQNNNISLNTSTDIRELYNALVLNEIDNQNKPDGLLFRKESVQVVSATQKEKHRGVMPESKIIESMNDSLDFLKTSALNALIKTAIFHYLFGYIHPFYDGNGRTSRFISSYLIKKELNPLVALRLSYTIKNNIHKYYKAFEVCNDIRNKGDLTPFVLLFLKILKEASYGIYEKICELEERLEYYENKLLQLNLKTYQKECLFILIQNSLFEETFVSVYRLSQILGKGLTSTRKVIHELEEINLVLKQKKNRMYVYSANLDSF